MTGADPRRWSVDLSLLVFLTRSEAAELRDAAEQLLQNFQEPGWHAHVASPDFQTEMTLAPDIPQARRPLLWLQPAHTRNAPLRHKSDGLKRRLPTRHLRQAWIVG